MQSATDHADGLAHVSSALRGDDDRDLVCALLDVAGGLAVEPRVVTERQLRLLRDHRVVPLMPESWRLATDDDLVAMRRRIAVSQLRLYATLDDIVERFAAVGIEGRALKGLATARLDYDRPAQRQTGDVDLLIRPESLQPAIDVLVAIGGHGRGVHAAADPFAKGGRIDLPNGVQIDLHTRLIESGASCPDLLFAEPQPIPASSALALPAPLRLVHAAAHFAYTPPGHRRLSGLADISALRLREDIDLDEVRQLAGALGVERLTGYALHLERDVRGLPVDDLGAWSPPTRLERWSYARSERQLVMERVQRLASIDGIGRRARYLWQSVLPPREQVRLRGGWVGYFRRLLPRRLGGQNLERAR